jgi:site-specific recombinase XerD
MPELKTALERYVGEREQQSNIVDVETVFLARNGTSLNPSSIRKLVKKYYTKAGVRKSACILSGIPSACIISITAWG